MPAGEALPGKWSDAFLDEMREVGDPLADDVVTALFASGRIYSVWDAIGALDQNDQSTPAALPDFLQQYLDKTDPIAHVDPATVQGGQRLFETHGPEILMVLAFYSLPASYAARKGVQVLYRTGYLNNRANHRLAETTRMAADVLVPGGLGPGARGVRSAQKVRLLHAAVRHLILNDPENKWDSELGLPINQEDLAGTLMVFTYLILDGLERLHIPVTPEQQQGYLDTWKVIARLVGVREELIPANMAEAKQLSDHIQQRQVQVCAEGKAMNQALLDLMEQRLPPGPWRSWPSALMRHFLPPAIADGFGLSGTTLEERFDEQAAQLSAEPGQASDLSDERLNILRKFALLFVDCYVSVELRGQRSPFILPTTLHHGWAKSRIPSLWQQLTRK